MLAAIKAGIAYFACVFAIGAVLGVLRVGGLAPRLGVTGAVLVEIPIILAASWVICRRLVAWLAVPATTSARLVMGGLALALLLLAELGLSMTLLGRTLAQHVASYLDAPQALGLAAQLVFALMPVLARESRLTPEPPSDDR